MEIQEKKKELISRISNVENTEVLDEIEKILNANEFSFEYNLEEDVKNGLTAEEFKRDMFNRMEKFPWKK